MARITITWPKASGKTVAKMMRHEQTGRRQKIIAPITNTVVLITSFSW